MYEPVLCLILQGRKVVSIGDETLAFGPGECLLVSSDLPVRTRITKAPYLALVLEVDVASIRKLYDEVTESARGNERVRAAVTQRADPGLLDALGRYLALADSPADAKVLGPLTSATPLQYQNELRLLEARRLLRTGGASVTTAAFDVGYESPSQFSREYARKFGVPPSQEMANGTD